jgi:multisubunit Na+/H+ antiporter MnhE subunit
VWWVADSDDGGEGVARDASDAADDGGPKPGSAVVVPVEPTPTLRSTVAHAVEEAIDGEYAAIHFVEIASWRDGDPDSEDRTAEARRVLERVTAWAEADLEDVDGDAGDDVTVVSALIGAEEYLFGPDDYVEVLAEYAAEHGAETVLLDPEYTPVGNTTLLQPLEFALSNTSLTVRTAPVGRPTRRERLLNEATGVRFAAMFGLSLAFYFVLGDPFYWFDWVTGVATAAIVSITLSRVSFDTEPSLSRTPRRLVRAAIYVPVLLYEVVKSNLVVARVILDPRLPIEPTLNRVSVIVGGGLPLMTLANSITLTPGTLTVRARDSDLYVHSLLPWAREGLFDGSLERWTRFVYYGRSAARLPPPRDSDEYAILQGPEAAEELPIAAADGGAAEDAEPSVDDGEPSVNGGEPSGDDEVPTGGDEGVTDA